MFAERQANIRNRAERRRGAARDRQLFRAIESLVRTDGDFCSLCAAPFAHNSRSFGGETLTGEPALVGECCVGKLQTIVTSGVYLARSYDFLRERGSKSSAEKGYTAEQIDKAISATGRRSATPTS